VRDDATSNVASDALGIHMTSTRPNMTNVNEMRLTLPGKPVERGSPSSSATRVYHV
jgi:hypothetical protein